MREEITKRGKLFDALVGEKRQKEKEGEGIYGKPPSASHYRDSITFNRLVGANATQSVVGRATVTPVEQSKLDSGEERQDNSFLSRVTSSFYFLFFFVCFIYHATIKMPSLRH